MHPIELEEEQRVFLPEHTVVTFAKDQPEYRQLPAVIFTGPERRVISRWTLTPDERAKIAAGEDLYVEQLTFGSALQPILPTVGLRDFCPADATH